MSTQLSSACVYEIQNLTAEAQRLAKGNRSTEANTILAQVATLRQTGLSTDEMRGMFQKEHVEHLDAELGIVRENEAQALYARAFGRYLAGHERGSIEGRLNQMVSEMRAIADSGAAPNSQTFVDGPAGAYFTPQGFDTMIRDAEIQSSGGLLSNDVISVIDEPTFGLPAKSVQGFNLTAVTASSVAESTQLIDTPNLATVAPAYSAQITNANLYRIALAVSLEAEEDIQGFQARIANVVGVAMARKVGKDLLTTLTNAVSPTLSTANSGYITLDDVQNIVFSVDRLYRQGQPNALIAKSKCGWIMPDSVWQRICRSGSGQSSSAKGVPYLSLYDAPGVEYLAGYPVYITPDAGSSLIASPAVNSQLFFGDLSKLILRRGKMYCIRSFQSKGVGGVDYGQATIRCTQRAGSVYFDAGSNAAGSPAVVCATVTA